MESKMSIAVVILAAGRGTRMKSDLPKALHRVCGRPMMIYVVDTARELTGTSPLVVVGHGAEQVRQALGNLADTVLQEPQLGTGHAVMQARAALEGKADTVLVAYGDTPFISVETLRAMLERHATENAAATLLTFHPPDPLRFGRIVRKEAGPVQAVVEFKEAAPEQKTIRECNSGINCFQANWLWSHIGQLPVKHGERYLTDLVKLAVAEGRTVATFEADPDEVMGIDDRARLAWAETKMRARINEQLMRSGVTMVDPATTYIEASVTIGTDTIILPNTHLRGKTLIGRTCEIGPNAVIEDSVIGDRCVVKASFFEGATLEDDVEVGPFAHLRKGAHLCNHVHMGNFGEVKNSRLGPGTKMGHFSYVGDADVGAEVNISCGVITCNYDGKKKHKTVIGEGAFVGSDTLLRAPVTIGRDAVTGAGSVVTHDVPDGALAYGVPARVQSKKEE
jgi:bifunctional UDP-N-acetylglucosamine pyrophosphorylase/glucosamine-1-phosphate N-acetyltransferase